MNKGTSPNRWSEDEIAKLMSLYRQYRSIRRKWDTIAAQMPGRSRMQCQEKVRYQQHGRRMREIYAPTKIKNQLGSHYVAPPVVTPASVWADAARRRQLMRPTITAEFFGDPLPGYSALDRMARR